MSTSKKKITYPTFTTPPGTALFPKLQEADTRFDANGVFSVKLRWPSAEITPLMNKIEELNKATLAKLGETDKKKAKLYKVAENPFKPVYDEEGEETGEIEATFKMKANITWKDKNTGEVRSRSQRPLIVNAKLKPTKANPWSGSVIAVNFTAKTGVWETHKAVGTSLQLEGAQIIKLVHGGGKTAEEMGFGSYEDGFDDSGEDDDFSSDTSLDSDVSPVDSAAEEDDGNF